MAQLDDTFSPLILADVRFDDTVQVSGTDGAGLFHDSLLGVVGTRSHDAIKVWPFDEREGDGSGKLWFHESNIAGIVVVEQSKIN